MHEEESLLQLASGLIFNHSLDVCSTQTENKCILNSSCTVEAFLWILKATEAGLAKCTSAFN